MAQPPTTAEYGLLMPSNGHWIQLFSFLVLVVSVGVGVGYLLYKSVVEPKKAGTSSAYLVGFGLVLPFWMSLPVLLLNNIDIRNVIFRFLIGAIFPIVCSFRTTETIFGLCPEYVTKSAKDFCFYYAGIPIVAREKAEGGPTRAAATATGTGTATTNSNEDLAATASKVGEPILCSNAKKVKHLVTFVGLLFLTGGLQSILTPHLNMNVFGTGDGIESNDEMVSSLWHSTDYRTWQLYANSSLQALLFQMYLATYLEALTFAFSVLTGYEAEPAMDNPLLESQSVTEFWGKRWNLVIHTVLKNGVYKPLRWKCSVPRDAAILTTFLASGAFHEWILYVIYSVGSGTSNRKDTFAPIYGGSMVFFAWQALLMGLELAFGKTVLVRKAARILPRPLKTALVVAMGLPPAHFFLAPYVESFFFKHGAIGLPMIIRVR